MIENTRLLVGFVWVLGFISPILSVFFVVGFSRLPAIVPSADPAQNVPNRTGCNFASVSLREKSLLAEICQKCFYTYIVSCMMDFAKVKWKFLSIQP